MVLISRVTSSLKVIFLIGLVSDIMDGVDGGFVDGVKENFFSLRLELLKCLPLK